MRKYIILLVVLSFINQKVYTQNLTLNSFLELVELENLDLKVQKSMNEVEKNKSGGLKIAPPSIAYIQRDFESEKARGFEVSQVIPFPGKIANEKKVRVELAKASEYEYQTKRNEILSRARLVYTQYWLQFEMLKVLNEKKKIIQEHVELAKSVVRSNSLMKIHLFKAQSDLDLLENEIYEQEQKLIEKRFNISELLNKPADFIPGIPIRPPMIELRENFVSETPQIKNLEMKLSAAMAQELENKKAWLPDFKLSYMELNSTSMMPEHSQIGIGITLPFLNPWDATAKSSSATAQRMVSEYQLAKGKRKVVFTQARLIEEAKTLKKQIKLIEEKLLPRAKETMKLVNNIAPRDMNSLQDHRDGMEAFANLNLQALKIRNRYEQVVSELLNFSTKKEFIYE